MTTGDKAPWKRQGVETYVVGTWNDTTLRPRQNGRHFADDTFKRVFMNENVRISINISLKCVPKGLINNIIALVQIMAWRRPGDKPLSEPMMVNSLTHICVTRPQWVNITFTHSTLLSVSSTLHGSWFNLVTPSNCSELLTEHFAPLIDKTKMKSVQKEAFSALGLSFPRRSLY